MTFDKEKERQLARQARLVAVVFAMTIVLWMAGQWLGGELGWEVRYVLAQAPRRLKAGRLGPPARTTRC